LITLKPSNVSLIISSRQPYHGRSMQLKQYQMRSRDPERPPPGILLIHIENPDGEPSDMGPALIRGKTRGSPLPDAAFPLYVRCLRAPSHVEILEQEAFSTSPRGTGTTISERRPMFRKLMFASVFLAMGPMAVRAQNQPHTLYVRCGRLI